MSCSIACISVVSSSCSDRVETSLRERPIPVGTPSIVKNGAKSRLSSLPPTLHHHSQSSSRRSNHQPIGQRVWLPHGHRHHQKVQLFCYSTFIPGVVISTTSCAPLVSCCPPQPFVDVLLVRPGWSSSWTHCLRQAVFVPSNSEPLLSELL